MRIENLKRDLVRELQLDVTNKLKHMERDSVEKNSNDDYNPGEQEEDKKTSLKTKKASKTEKDLKKVTIYDDQIKLLFEP